MPTIATLKAAGVTPSQHARDMLQRSAAGEAAAPRRLRRQAPRPGYERQGGTAELHQHHEVAEALTLHDGENGVTKAYTDRVLDQDSLDYLARRSCITAPQYLAGRTLHGDWFAAGYENLHAADMGRIRVDGGGNAREGARRLAAQQRIKAAMVVLAAARGERCAAIVVAVCVEGKRLGKIEAEWCWLTKGGASEVLKRGLDLLDEHYSAVGGYEG